MQYTLKIFTEIKADDFEDSMEVSYPCRYSFENGIHRLKYTDEEAGFTVVKVSPDGEIEIRRKKSFTIVYQKGVCHCVRFENEYGSIPLTFSLVEASHSLTSEGGVLAYTAQVTLDGQPQINQTTMLLIPNERNDETL